MTTINFSTNCAVAFPVTASTANRIQEEVRRACRCQEAEVNDWNKEWVIVDALFRFGIGSPDPEESDGSFYVNPTTGHEVSGVYNLIEVDDDGNRWLTPIADIISRGTRCYDWSDYGVERVAGIEPAEDEFLCSYGGAHYAYKAVLPLNNSVPYEVREYFSALAEKYYHLEVEAAKAELFSARKSWGQKKNEELAAAGCSSTEIRAWWSMTWKKEWYAPDWKKFCKYTDEQISLAMAGESGDYLDAVLGRTWHGSVPRTKDAVKALGKARGLKRRYWRDWKKGGTIVRPVEEGPDGRLWRF
jgi:hypothetical protein